MTFEEALIEHCSPTLAGVKPASLFRFCPRDSALFARRFLALRQQFAARGLRLVILKGCRRTATPRGRRPATACGSWPPASVWRRNSPTRSASFWAILWMT